MGVQCDRLYTAEQVRRLDACAIEGHGIPGMTLMERAGRSVFDALRQAFPSAAKILVLCGGGNNGGDGYIVARLAREAGLDAVVCALKSPDSLAGDAAAAARKWRDAGGAVHDWPRDRLDEFDVIVDALLGTGLDREPAGAYGEAVDAINGSGQGVIAVDIPSGLHADTGAVLGRAVRADLTVTFIGRKRGLFTAEGPDCAGRVLFNDLETPDTIRDSEAEYGILIREDLLAHWLPPRARNSHKGSYGWMAGVGSDLGMSGAVRLCGEAALRSGAGKVTLVTRPEHAGLVNVSRPELMVRGHGDATGLAELLGQVDVLVAGTGLGQSRWSEQMFRACLACPAPVVLDADGLNWLAQRSATLEADALPRGRWILTPHPAEAGRLLGVSAGEVQTDRVNAARDLAKKYEAVVVLKGCGTVVADSAGRYAICPLGNPGMASAGTGDVLSGVIGAMLAQGLGPWEAAAAGVVAHAAAGDLAASRQGERGLIAGDITDCLPAVLNPRRRA